MHIEDLKAKLAEFAPQLQANFDGLIYSITQPHYTPEQMLASLQLRSIWIKEKLEYINIILEKYLKEAEQ